MKTAISLPDELFRRAERVAKELGMTRSEFYAQAVDALVQHSERSSLTRRLDAAIARSGPDSETTDAVVSAGRRVVSDGDDW